MKRTLSLQWLARWLCACAAVACLHAHAAAGYMAFLQNGPTGTPVTTGDAASFMRSHWDLASLSGGAVVPSLLQKSKISTWRETAPASLRFKFEIPDVTRRKPDGSTLTCGDQIVLQIGPQGAALVQGVHVRYELAIKDNLVATFQRRLPNAAGHPQVGRWKNSAELTTTALATVSVVNNAYVVDLTIPLSEIGTPTTDIGLALAIINDLGLQSASGDNFASGTAFPIGMGLTPESDPGLTCGSITVPTGELATGSWRIPSTWGVGYFAVSSTVPAPEVTLDNGPTFAFSRAIRIGNCTVTSFADIPEVSASNWTSIQTAIGTKWYEYNPDGPCRMGIWINAKLPLGSAIVKSRFLVVWGRPGIAPQEWYYAGLTGPVAISAPETALSFIWDKVPPVTFSDHPCMKVYVIPESADEMHPAIAAFKATPTQANLAAIELAFDATNGSSKNAQMNFANTKPRVNNMPSICTTSACQQIGASLIDTTSTRRMASFSLISDAQAQPTTGGPRSDGPSKGDDKDSLVRIVLHGFGIAAPRANKPYTYVEAIGGLGWAIPASRLAQEAVTLNFEMANPAFTERMVVDQKMVEVASVDRRIGVLPLIDVVPGTPLPKLDLNALTRFADTPVKPGEVAKVQITVLQTGSPVGGMRWWWIVLIAILLLVLIAYVLRRKSGP